MISSAQLINEGTDTENIKSKEKMINNEDKILLIDADDKLTDEKVDWIFLVMVVVALQNGIVLLKRRRRQSR